MKVFISWSGERSRKVGELFNEWLQCVLQAVDPWMSSKNIERGTAWFPEITEQLGDTTIGVICLTQENKNKPWILFEAGALAKGLSSNRVCTFLIDLEATDLEPPLSQFNHTFFAEESVLNLVFTINSKLESRALKEGVLLTVFNTYWPQFNEKMLEILKQTPPLTPTEARPADDILNEILLNTRSFDKRIGFLESSITKNNNNIDHYSSVIRERSKLSSAKKYASHLIETDMDPNEVTSKIALRYDLSGEQAMNLTKMIIMKTRLINKSENVDGE